MSELRRVLEPEIMDDEQEAADYDSMDHSGVNARFVEDLLALGPDLRSVLDVGTGTALIPLELLRRAPQAQVLAVDLAGSMLDVGRTNVRRAGLDAAILLEAADAKALPYGDGSFAVVVSNSLVHHIPEPQGALAEMLRVLAPGGTLLVRDLVRPQSDAEVAELVARHAASDTPRQRALFEASLRAALSFDELRAMLLALGVPTDALSLTSDRHWTLAWRRPSLPPAPSPGRRSPDAAAKMPRPPARPARRSPPSLRWSAWPPRPPRCCVNPSRFTCVPWRSSASRQGEKEPRWNSREPTRVAGSRRRFPCSSGRSRRRWGWLPGFTTPPRAHPPRSRGPGRRSWWRWRGGVRKEHHRGWGPLRFRGSLPW